MRSFDDSEFGKYKDEVNEKWGNTVAYKEHAEKTKNYSKQKWSDLAAEMDNIMAEFAICMKNGTAPDSDEVQVLVKALQSHISENYYNCTDEQREPFEKFHDCWSEYMSLAEAACFQTRDANCYRNIDQHKLNIYNGRRRSCLRPICLFAH